MIRERKTWLQARQFWSLPASWYAQGGRNRRQESDWPSSLSWFCLPIWSKVYFEQISPKFFCLFFFFSCYIYFHFNSWNSIYFPYNLEVTHFILQHLGKHTKKANVNTDNYIWRPQITTLDILSVFFIRTLCICLYMWYSKYYPYMFSANISYKPMTSPSLGQLDCDSQKKPKIFIQVWEIWGIEL